MVYLLQKEVHNFFKTLKIELPHSRATSPLHIYQET